MSSTTTTLNGDVEVLPKDLEKSFAAHKEQYTIEEQGATTEFIFVPIPRYLRYKPGEPFHFDLLRICFLSIGTIFLVANLFYYQPLLIQMSKTFNVSYQEISKIPTLMEAGYATGTFFMSPFGDLIRRRQLLLILILSSASLTVGLAVTHSFLVFQILAFLTGMCSISPQIIVSLVKDHAHPSRKSAFSAVVLAGYLAGIVTARLLGGVIAQFLDWKFVYYFAFATQYSVLLLCYCSIPDFPAKNQKLSYTGILLTMLKYATTEPAMVQAELVNMALGVGIATYSITLTFLLGGSPYNYSTLKIGLFGLTDTAGIILSLFAGRLVDWIAPWYTSLISATGIILFQAIQTATGGSNLAALIVACVGIDALRQLQYISLAASIYTVSIESVSHLNTLLVFSYYLGQLIGTSVGSKIFVDHGWRVSAAFGLAWYGLQITIVLLRGPHCRRRRWFGYS